MFSLIWIIFWILGFLGLVVVVVVTARLLAHASFEVAALSELEFVFLGLVCCEGSGRGGSVSGRSGAMFSHQDCLRTVVLVAFDLEKLGCLLKLKQLNF